MYKPQSPHLENGDNSNRPTYLIGLVQESEGDVKAMWRCSQCCKVAHGAGYTCRWAQPGNVNESRRPDLRKVIVTSQWEMATDTRRHYPACGLWKWKAQAHRRKQLPLTFSQVCFGNRGPAFLILLILFLKDNQKFKRSKTSSNFWILAMTS